MIRPVESSKLKWWHVRWKRVGLTLLIAFGSIYLLELVYEQIDTELRPWSFARQMAHDQPGLFAIPRPVDPHSDALAGDRVDCFGLSFQSPWGTALNERSFRHLCLLSSSNGASITVLDPAIRLEPSGTGYEFWTAVLNTTPDDVKWWRMRYWNASSFALLLQKGIEIHDFMAVYTVGFGEMRGFQLGDPSVRPFKVALDLFDKNDRHFRVNIYSQDERHALISQAQINAMISSMRSASYTPSARH